MTSEIQKFVEELERENGICPGSDLETALALIKVMESALDEIENGDDPRPHRIAREARAKCMEILK